MTEGIDYSKYEPTDEDRRKARGVVLKDIINKDERWRGLLDKINKLKANGNPNSIQVQQLEATAEQRKADVHGILCKARALKMDSIDEVHKYKGCEGIYVNCGEYVSAMCEVYGVNRRRIVID